MTLEARGKPSLALLMRMMRVLADNNLIGRTSLSQITNIHYTRLQEHLTWLETKGYIKLAIRDGKVIVELTDKGREFASKLLTISE